MNNTRFFFALLLCLLGGAAASASPAYPRKHNVRQADGTEITLQGHGNEYCHWLTDGEGREVVLCDDGIYRPAEKPHSLATGAERLLRRADRTGEQESVARRMPRRTAGTGRSYKGLVLLVEFNDCTFRFGDEQTRTLYGDMLNQRNYTGYQDRLYGGWQQCPGSVRDYFLDNSYGQFDPQFDVVGPILLNVSSTYINAVARTYDLTEMILAAADSLVDYSQYDSDGDGDVDMFYILYAGYSSMYQGNDERLVWPHATTMVDATGEEPDIVYDGVRMARFAVSNELYGWQQDRDAMIDGIGTIVHEFSHVLGFQDHYDTSAGYQEHPNSWDVMDGGNYSEDYNRTPCAYNSYEKATAGFITPLDITDCESDSITLRSTEKSTDALLLRSTQEHVCFYMENRQRDKWDRWLVGHGLLVWRVDSVRPEYWEQNILNVTSRACFRLVRACGTQGSFLTGVVDTDYDPFPGTRNVTFLNNEPYSADLLSYDQYPAPAVLSHITEADSVISLRVERDTLADARPISYDPARRLHATAERLNSEVWEPVEWDVTRSTVLISNQETDVYYNLLPNTPGLVQNNSAVEGQFFVPYTTQRFDSYTIPARRLYRATDYSIWIGNSTDVAAGGGGSILFTTDRHGVPQIEGEDTQLALFSLTADAYLLAETNVIARLAVYRHIRFSEAGNAPQGLEQTEAATAAVKKIVDGKVVIERDGRTYNVLGMEM